MFSFIYRHVTFILCTYFILYYLQLTLNKMSFHTHICPRPYIHIHIYIFIYLYIYIYIYIYMRRMQCDRLSWDQHINQWWKHTNIPPTNHQQRVWCGASILRGRRCCASVTALWASRPLLIGWRISRPGARCRRRFWIFCFLRQELLVLHETDYAWSALSSCVPGVSHTYTHTHTHTHTHCEHVGMQTPTAFNPPPPPHTHTHICVGAQEHLFSLFSITTETSELKFHLPETRPRSERGGFSFFNNLPAVFSSFWRNKFTFIYFFKRH